MRARDNPFATERIERLAYRFGDESRNALLDRLDALGRRAAIVGPPGSGKTTLLSGLARPLAARGWRPVAWRVGARGRSALPLGPTATLGAKDLLLLDGMERLPRLWASWLRFCTRGCAGLVVTSHRPVALPTLVTCSTSPQLLGDLAAELLATRAAALPFDPAELLGRHDGDVRAALLELYDVWAGSAGMVRASDCDRMVAGPAPERRRAWARARRAE